MYYLIAANSSITKRVFLKSKHASVEIPPNRIANENNKRESNTVIKMEERPGHVRLTFSLCCDSARCAARIRRGQRKVVSISGSGACKLN